MLLVALVVCACGGGGDDRAGAADTAAAAPPTAAPTAAATTDTCTSPPPAYGADLLAGPWSMLVARLAADGVTFPRIPGNDTTVEMKLCAGCSAVAVRMHSSRLSPCLAAEHLTGDPRIVSMLVLQADFPSQHGWQALSSGDTVLVFASTASGPAVLVHNSGGTARLGPAGAMGFVHCNDGHSSSQPQIRWETRGASNTPGNDVSKGKDDIGFGCGNASCRGGCCWVCCCPDGFCPRS